MQELEDVPPADCAWQDYGHEWIGRRVRRKFPNQDESDDEEGDEEEGETVITDGKIVAYLPAGSEEGQMALWKMRHDDGDMEDLEEHEVEEGLQLAGACARVRDGSGGGGGKFALCRKGEGHTAYASPYACHHPLRQLAGGGARVDRPQSPPRLWCRWWLCRRQDHGVAGAGEHLHTST